MAIATRTTGQRHTLRPFHFNGRHAEHEGAVKRPFCHARRHKRFRNRGSGHAFHAHRRGHGIGARDFFWQIHRAGHGGFQMIGRETTNARNAGSTRQQRRPILIQAPAERAHEPNPRHRHQGAAQMILHGAFSSRASASPRHWPKPVTRMRSTVPSPASAGSIAG